MVKGGIIISFVIGIAYLALMFGKLYAQVNYPVPKDDYIVISSTR